MTMKRVVDSVALVALLPIAGVIACGSEGGTGDGNPAPVTTVPYPGPTAGNPPIIGGGPPIAGTPTSNPTSPVPTNTPPGTVPTNTPPGTVPTNTAPNPVPTSTVPGPVPTTPTPTPTATTPILTPGPTLPAPSYDAAGILLPPAAAAGYQVTTPAFTLQPGAEQFRCYHASIPSDAEVPVGRWVSQMSPGSHHFILYAGGTAQDGAFDPNGCAGGLSNQWVYASSKPDNQMPMPDGVAMPMAAHQKINFDMHYINTGSSPLTASVRLNIERSLSPNPQRAGALVSFNVGINIPPQGDQTVSGSCATPADAQFFILSTHTHKYATVANIRVGSETGQELVHTTDWENPDTKVWLQAPFFSFGGQRLYYSCTYHNTTSNQITVGTSAIRNEMCMAVTYFFPAASGSQACR